MSDENDKKPPQRERTVVGFRNLLKETAQTGPPELGADKKELMDENRLAFTTEVTQYVRGQIEEIGEHWNLPDRDRLALKLFRATNAWDFEAFQKLAADRNVPLDYTLPGYHSTILHAVAGYGSLRMFEVLLEREDELKYLARDWKGRLPSQLAALHSHRNDLSGTLMQKELDAADSDPKVKAVTPRLTFFQDGTTDPPVDDPGPAPTPSNG